MAMKRNIEKRNEILYNAFELISKAGYNKVFLRNIAEKSNINKSLLQIYFPKKNDIVENILDELLCISFNYIDQILPLSNDIYLKLAVYTRLFWGSTLEHNNVNRFVENIIVEKELLDIWINIVYKWLNNLQDTGNMFSEDKLKIALAFSISGGMQLYRYRDEFNIDVLSICNMISRAFMEIMEIDEKKIKETIIKAKSISNNFDMEKFFLYCKEQISWFDPSW